MRSSVASRAGRGIDMHPIARPTSPAEAVFAAAVPSKYNKSDRARFAAEIPTLCTAGAAYETAAATGTITALVRSAYMLPTVTDKEMRAFYSYRMRRKGAAQRHHYDKLMAAPRYARCPYCGERRVKTLDHYLPQSTFSALAVTATNLVPACSDCNKSKADYAPSATRPALLHPYFDNLDQVQWLQAEVIPGDPPAITFFVDDQAFTNTLDAARVQNHFEVFDLHDLFASHAAQTVDELDARLPGLFKAGGGTAVRQHVLELVQYLPHPPTNIWKRALYTALAANTWYCNSYASNL